MQYCFISYRESDLVQAYLASNSNIKIRRGYIIDIKRQFQTSKTDIDDN
jgi:hypothetical protein